MGRDEIYGTQLYCYRDYFVSHEPINIMKCRNFFLNTPKNPNHHTTTTPRVWSSCGCCFLKIWNTFLVRVGVLMCFLGIWNTCRDIPWNWKIVMFVSCGPFPSYDFWNLFVTFPVLCNIWFLCQHVPCLNRKKTWTSRSILGVLWGMLEREMYIVVPNYSKAWQKVLLFESSPKTNIYKYIDSHVLKLIIKFYEQTMNKHIFCVSGIPVQ